MTVTADQGLPVGVATSRLFRMRAISRADLSAGSSNGGASAFARTDLEPLGDIADGSIIPNIRNVQTTGGSFFVTIAADSRRGPGIYQL
jgi:hypothetical protein